MNVIGGHNSNRIVESERERDFSHICWCFEIVKSNNKRRQWTLYVVT